jgi:hypothetical protein
MLEAFLRQRFAQVSYVPPLLPQITFCIKAICEFPAPKSVWPIPTGTSAIWKFGGNSIFRDFRGRLIVFRDTWHLDPVHHRRLRVNGVVTVRVGL